MAPSSSRCVSAAAGGLAALALAAGAHGQALERNLPPAPNPEPSVITPPEVAGKTQDATSIGPALRAIVLLGPTDAIKSGPRIGVDAEAAARLSAKRARGALEPFLGRPLSRRLIGQVQAAVAHAYRQAGYPFVSVSTPPQELTLGVLQLRVIEFRLGQVTIRGEKPQRDAYLRSRIRVQTGQPISGEALSEDLDALNRYPFRRVDATFTPGASLGQSDLILNVTQTKPWSAYVGYSNSGSPSTGWDRYFAGAQVGGLLGPDSLVSDQVTASSDVLFDTSRLFNGVSHPQYLSDALAFTAPIVPRGQIEGGFDWVETSEVSKEASGLFTVLQTTYEGHVGYRFDLSNLAPDFIGWGDARFGIEAKHQQTETLFGGAEAADVGADVYQAYLGYSNSRTDAWGRSDLDILLHISPGGIGEGNSKSQALLFSQGRVSDVRYAYFDLTYSRTTKLPFGLALTNQLTGQYSARALQGTEQMGIGGQGLVRGYVLDDGAYDEAIILRNELRGPALAPGPTAWAGQVSPYLFADLGSGRDQNSGHTVSPSSVGAGADIALVRRVSVSLDGTYAINSAVVTRAGDWRLETRATVAF